MCTPEIGMCHMYTNICKVYIDLFEQIYVKLCENTMCYYV